MAPKSSSKDSSSKDSSRPAAHSVPKTALSAPRAVSPEEERAARAAADKFKTFLPVEATFTANNIERFMTGDISFAQLMAVSEDQAYAVAEYGYTLFEEGRTKEARKIYESLVLFNPADSYMHLVLGCIYWKLDMPEEAVDEFGIVIRLEPSSIAAHVNRGELLLQHGEIEDAIEDLRAAIALDKKGDDPHGLRARALAAAAAEVLEAQLKKISKKK